MSEGAHTLRVSGSITGALSAVTPPPAACPPPPRVSPGTGVTASSSLPPSLPGSALEGSPRGSVQDGRVDPAPGAQVGSTPESHMTPQGPLPSLSDRLGHQAWRGHVTAVPVLALSPGLQHLVLLTPHRTGCRPPLQGDFSPNRLLGTWIPLPTLSLGGLLRALRSSETPSSS